MKRNLIIIIAIVVAFSGACSINKDAEINSFITELNGLSTEIVRTVNETPTTPGVEQAQQLLDARKEKLKTSFEKLKDVRGFQVSDEMKKKMNDSVTKSVAEVNRLQIKYVSQTVTDKSFGQKLSKLSADFNSILGV
jgi:hypothetical protein